MNGKKKDGRQRLNFVPENNVEMSVDKKKTFDQSSNQIFLMNTDTICLVLAGLFTHLVFFYSIFDIYFTSPLVHGMTPHVSPQKPAASRLVLFSADGLRADKFFGLDENGQSRAPYLRNIIRKHGAWGVSHTRVPTESRPGHVALIAGFYEDVSAVAKGWKENPVEFDSVFNQSRYTWSWGSPDILPMFAKGASGDHVLTEMYTSDEEDFAASHASDLDTWVFDKVRAFFEGAKLDKDLYKKLQKDKLVFFLHLLGIDTNGHSHKPHSKVYLKNIELVDTGIREMVKLFDDFYDRDGKTTFIMSSDHGMTNWGSHGAGNPHETLTPIVAWGAGIRGPLVISNQVIYPDTFSQEWKLHDIKRTDVNQADIAPLMSSVIGVPYPMNSVGTLPLSFLSSSDFEKAESTFANAQQILEQYQVKMDQKKSTTLSVAFRPFSKLLPSIQKDRIRNIRNLINSGQYQLAITESQTLIELGLEGLNYYHGYDRFFLGLSIVFGFVGWMIYTLTLVVRDHSGLVSVTIKLEKLSQPVWLQDKPIKLVFAIIGVAVTVLLKVQSLLFTNYMYCLIPVVLWMFVALRLTVFQQLFKKFNLAKNLKTVFIAIVPPVLGLEILVMGFFRRELLSVGLVMIAAWPLITSKSIWKDKVTAAGWIVSCLLLSVFPLAPVVGRQINYIYVITSGVFVVVSATYLIFWLKRSHEVKKERKLRHQHIFLVNIIQVVVIGLATYNVWTVSSSIARSQGLPFINRLTSYLILVFSMISPFLGGTSVTHRLFTVTLALFPPYLLLSISYEDLFFVTLTVVLYFWMKLEINLNDKKVSLEDCDFVASSKNHQHRSINTEDIRRAFYYIFFILVAFFGTGNIASINSFEPASVYCFITKFDPFMMGSLMMLKNVLPFVLVSCVFHAIHVLTSIPTKALFLIVLIMSDFMALNFFFLVRDYGSWLEIGTSISHYVIVMCMIIFLMVLFVLSHALTTVSVLPRIKHSRE
ncbi:GPI ethanolamine phosphate transferase 1-like [Mytilus californianus]|uniref:GPI ethanolamine phosphate transferase 1-like n=1 Tax=Mytilus californianus TaxID=6549 RepID=UPI0022484888|nr:GPI ethanolamine phosphate transferase 1-like [Mytilus californianus]